MRMMPPEADAAPSTPGSVPKKGTVFVSYTSVDQDAAEWIGWQLEELHCDAIIQCWDFHAYKSFLTQMDDALKSGARVLAVLSLAYMKSDYCRDEWQVARSIEKRHKRDALCCVRIEEFDVEGILS